jgi:hypothetical protein
MMRSNLKLNGGVRGPSTEDLAKAAQQKQARAVQELDQQLKRQLELLSNIGSSMGDGGAKVRGIGSCMGDGGAKERDKSVLERMLYLECRGQDSESLEG